MTKKRFQQYAELQPWLAVAETVSFGPSRAPSGADYIRFIMEFPFDRLSHFRVSVVIDFKEMTSLNA